MNDYEWLFVEDAKRKLWACNSRKELADVVAEFQLTNPLVLLDLDENGWSFKDEKTKERYDEIIKPVD